MHGKIDGTHRPIGGIPSRVTRERAAAVRPSPESVAAARGHLAATGADEAFLAIVILDAAVLQGTAGPDGAAVGLVLARVFDSRADAAAALPPVGEGLIPLGCGFSAIAEVTAEAVTVGLR